MKAFLVLLFCSVFSGEVFCQNLDSLEVAEIRLADAFSQAARAHENSERWDSAGIFHEKAIEIYRNLPKTKTQDLLAASLKRSGYCGYKLGDFERSVARHGEAAGLFEQLRDTFNVADSHYFIGRTHSQSGNLREALAAYERSMGLLRSNSTERQYLLKLADAAQNAGVANYQMGFLDKAIALLQQALGIKQGVLGENHPTVASLHRSLSALLGTFGQDLGMAVWHARKALEIFANHPNTPVREVYSAYQNLALAQKGLEKYDEARASFQSALDRMPARSRDRSFCFNGLGELFEDRNMPDSALFFFKKALEVLDSAQVPRVNFDRCGVLHNLAWGHIRAGQFEQAEVVLDSMLSATGFSGGPLMEAVFPLQVLGVFAEKGGLFRRKHFKTGLLEDLRTAHRNFMRFESLAREWRSARIEEDSEGPYAAEAHRAAQPSITVSLRLHRLTDSTEYLHRAFATSENVRALALSERFSAMRAEHFSGIPDSLLALDRELWRQIDQSQQERHAVGPKVVPELDDRIARLRAGREALRKNFETDYPEYYRLKYDLRTESIGTLQRDLLYPDQNLLEFFVGDSSVFLFRVGKTDFEVYETPKNFPLEQWVAELRSATHAFFTDPAMSLKYDSLAKVWTERSHALYQRLLAPVAAKLPKHLVIVPDGALGQLPFEVLLTEAPKGDPWRWQQHRYLNEKHAISYCPSATVLREMLSRRSTRPSEVPFYGFAPHFWGDTTLLAAIYPDGKDLRKDLAPLPHSGEEVVRLSKLMNGKYLAGEAATLENFARAAPSARILHLATHAQANDQTGDYCFLAFSKPKDSPQNELLYARDIYRLPLNAELVTLSACETGIGQLQNGEGVISLARAFTFAGAESVLTSLWRVNDAKTKDLMLDFYKNLRSGLFKDEALQQAKLDFLQKNKGQAAHPFFWASFVNMGNIAPLR